ncbi:hypothetical protein [Gallaecimonas mangrovi]|uniref:hypothetical protein n=1 Tax=Gallaecimonas mangrovi TaxID=2291597 RepID=UPI000E2045F3|nr:hypothetical protein [Gallaecimonas mangrovi]
MQNPLRRHGGIFIAGLLILVTAIAALWYWQRPVAVVNRTSIKTLYAVSLLDLWSARTHALPSTDEINAKVAQALQQHQIQGELTVGDILSHAKDIEKIRTRVTSGSSLINGVKRNAKLVEISFYERKRKVLYILYFATYHPYWLPLKTEVFYAYGFRTHQIKKYGKWHQAHRTPRQVLEQVYKEQFETISDLWHGEND